FIDKGVIKVLTGQRRVGKSYILFQLINDIKIDNPGANVIYINKEQEEFKTIRTDGDLSDYIQEHLIHSASNYLFIDDLQDIEQCVNSIPGSNARMLSSVLANY